MLDNHIAFLDEYFRNNFNAGKAYATCYPNAKKLTSQSNGSTLIKKLAVEIEDRHEVIRLREEIKNEDVIGELKTLKQLCIDTDDRANLIKTITLLAKINGLLNEKVDVKASEKYTIILNLKELKKDNPTIFLDLE